MDWWSLALRKRGSGWEGKGSGEGPKVQVPVWERHARTAAAIWQKNKEEAPVQLDTKTYEKVMIIQAISYNTGTKLQTKGNISVTGNRSKPI